MQDVEAPGRAKRPVMNKRAAWTLLPVLALAGCAWAQPVSDRAPALSPIVGTWRVVSVQSVRPDGTVSTGWLGKHPTGSIVYLASGYIAVQIMRDPRPEIPGDGDAAATTQAKAAAMDGYYAYYGTYKVDAQSRTITHNVEASLRPDEVGKHYRRYYELDGDRLTLTTLPPDQTRGAAFNRLVWERMK
jgi:hypothetical protein